MSLLRTALAATVIAAAAGSASAAPNLIVNGNFSQYTNNNGQSNPAIGFQPGYNGTLTGWSNGTNPYYNFLFLAGSNPALTGAWGQYNNLGLWNGADAGAATNWNGSGPSGIGGNYMAMDGDFSTGPLSQTITGLTKGTVYAVTFWYAFGQQSTYTGATTQDLSVSLGGSKQSVPSYNLASKGFSGWMQDTFYLEADSSTDALAFLAFGNVQLPPFALISDISMVDAPEPAAWTMLGIGVAGLLGAARLRRSKARQPVTA